MERCLRTLGSTMLENWGLKTILSLLITAFMLLMQGLSWSVGGFDQVLLYLLLLMGIDFLFGFIRAWKNHVLSSVKMKYGAVKIMLYWGLVLVAGVMDQVLTANSVSQEGLKILNFVGFSINLVLRDLIIFYLSICEAISILEHLHSMGAPIPVWLVPRLRRYKDVWHEGSFYGICAVEEKGSDSNNRTKRNNRDSNRNTPSS